MRAADEMVPAWVDGVLQPVEKLDVHRRGLRHRAISVFVSCGASTLLQKRAAGKYHTPGLWSNACCTHPRWGESPEDCARRRLDEELGVAAGRLERRGCVVYRADVGGGLVEHEEVEMFAVEVSSTDLPPHNSAEVAETRWITYPALDAEVCARPDAFTPWLRIYLAEFRSLIQAAE